MVDRLVKERWHLTFYVGERCIFSKTICREGGQMQLNEKISINITLSFIQTMKTVYEERYILNLTVHDKWSVFYHKIDLPQSNH